MNAAGKTGLTRRHFIITATALFSPPISGPLLADSWPSEAQKSAWDAEVTPPFFDPEVSNPWGLDPRFLPQRVEARAGLVPGNIHVDAIARHVHQLLRDLDRQANRLGNLGNHVDVLAEDGLEQDVPHHHDRQPHLFDPVGRRRRLHALADLHVHPCLPLSLP